MDKLIMEIPSAGKTVKLPIFEMALKRNCNVTVIGKSGKGICMSDLLDNSHLLNNNYRKRHRVPLVRKGHSAYEVIKVYKKLARGSHLKKTKKRRTIYE